MNLFIKGYEKASGIEQIAKIIVKELKFNKTISAIRHNKAEYNIASFTEIRPDAIGLSLVLDTLESKFLSIISFTIQPADLIKIAPRRKRIK